MSGDHNMHQKPYSYLDFECPRCGHCCQAAGEEHMTKLEAWKAWCESAGTPDLATEFTLEQSSHGKAFSFAWESGAEHKRERIIAANAPEIERINTYIKELEEAVAAERNKVAQWMIERGYATGHGDSIEKLLEELEWQIEERIRNEREACAAVCDVLAVHPEYASDITKLAAQAIRARSEL